MVRICGPSARMWRVRTGFWPPMATMGAEARPCESRKGGACVNHTSFRPPSLLRSVLRAFPLVVRGEDAHGTATVGPDGRSFVPLEPPPGVSCHLPWFPFHSAEPCAKQLQVPQELERVHELPPVEQTVTEDLQQTAPFDVICGRMVNHRKIENPWMKE